MEWLKKKHGSIAALNKAWGSQRWSRHVDTWDEVQLPYGEGPGPFERQFDLRRYWSDVTIDVLRDLDAIRVRRLPEKPAISNSWDWWPGEKASTICPPTANTRVTAPWVSIRAIR